MAQLSRLAFIGNSLPRRCGIATFTTDLQQAIAGADRAEAEAAALRVPSVLTLAGGRIVLAGGLR